MADDVRPDADATLPGQSGVSTHLDAADDQGTHKVNLLAQFYLTLNVTYLATPRVEQSVVHARIDRLFREERSWRHAYEIEQLLCFIMTDAQLQTEWERRLAEAKGLKLEHIDAIEKGLSVEASVTADKRILLHRVLNDLQWFYSKRVQHRAAGERLMVRVSSLFMVALVTLFLVLFIQFGVNPAPPGGAAGQQVQTQGAVTPGGTGSAATPAESTSGAVTSGAAASSAATPGAPTGGATPPASSASAPAQTSVDQPPAGGGR